jgi:hypothetical protein
LPEFAWQIPREVGGCITHQVPDAQSALLQQYRVQRWVVPKQVKPPMQYGPPWELQLPHAGTLFGEGKHEKAVPLKSHASPLAVLHPALVTGLQP